jgi:hypothetical protein
VIHDCGYKVREQKKIVQISNFWVPVDTLMDIVLVCGHI